MFRDASSIMDDFVHDPITIIDVRPVLDSSVLSTMQSTHSILLFRSVRGRAWVVASVTRDRNRLLCRTLLRSKAVLDA
jgi:hypothetical protein